MKHTIVHTTDLVDESRAFEHCVALAARSGAKLVSLHANASDSAAGEMPEAADLLAKWGRGAEGFEFEKRVHRCCDDPVETLLDALKRIEPDLVVATTHQRNAITRFFAGSRAEAIAHNVTAPVLLFPDESRAFVDFATGALKLQHVLVPLGDAAESEAALRTAAWFAELAGARELQFTLLHVGPRADVDEAPLARPGWGTVHVDVETGDVLASILEHAGAADLVVMATRGHDSLADVLLGSHTDRVLHAAQRPLLSIGVHA